jgi:hypothetical protein
MFQEALLSKLPDTIMTIFEDAIETANKGLINWIFKHRGMKVLSVLSLPYTLPAEIVYATFTKYAPEAGQFISCCLSHTDRSSFEINLDCMSAYR